MCLILMCASGQLIGTFRKLNGRNSASQEINKNKAEGVCHLINKQICSLAEKEGGGRRAIEYLHISCTFVLANPRLTTV